MFERYASGRYSFQEIANLLNDNGHRTRAGRRFSKDTIADMLRNPFYAGKVVYKEGQRGDVGETHPGRQQPIISEELWAAAARIRERHHHASRSVQHEYRAYLLSQLVSCHSCGRKLRSQGTPTGNYYREVSYSRGYEDCPYSQRGTRMDRLHEQVSQIARQTRLPPDWQSDLQEMLDDDEEVDTLRNKRGRLLAERRRLKELYVRGEFEDDADLYRTQMERIRREMDLLPSADDLYQIGQAAHLMESLSAVWDQADPGDQRDLLRLMLREVRVDVLQGRIVLLYPSVPFIPLFRSVPQVREVDFGVFAPAWPVAMANELPYSALPPLSAVSPAAPALPFVDAWPWSEDAAARISPHVSQALKVRRQMGHEEGCVVEVPVAGVPAVRLDGRKWPAMTVCQMSVAQALALPESAIAVLTTPLAVQAHGDREEMVRGMAARLEVGGCWHIIDILPASMPAHWVFAYFPDAWRLAHSRLWSGHDFYNALRQAGLQVTQKEHTFFQAVSLGAAQMIARRREGLLALLPDDVYEMGLQRLEQAIAEQGEEALVSSEFTLIEILAVKGESSEKPAEDEPVEE